MGSGTKAIVVLAVLSAAPGLFAGDMATVKCTANQDRIWVYDALNSFDVQAKLKCGEPVEILSRVKGFVKIKTASGIEGWVPDSALPGLPPLEEDKPTSGIPVAARARANAATRPLADATVQPSAPLNPPAAVTESGRAPASSVTPAPAVARASAPAEVVLTTSASAASPATAVTPAKARSVAGTPAAAPSAKPASATVAHPAASTSHPANGTAASKASAAPPSSASSKTAAAKSTTPQPTPGGAGRSNGPAPAPAAPPAKPAPAAASSAQAIENPASLQPVHDTARMHAVAATTESEDYPDFQPENQSEDPACQMYFSAYGLAPSQFKWMAQNRKKKYPSICPAPDPSKVDFVLIFTHDVDIYSSTLPVPVHTDKNGFSDFSPMMTVDNAIISESAADKARRDYVWVFQFKRGAFDPGRFSPRRRPQFTKSEAKSLGGSPAGPRTVEDALHFIEEQGTSH